MAFPAPAMAPGSFMDEDMIPTDDLDARIAHVGNWEFATVGNRPSTTSVAMFCWAR